MFLLGLMEFLNNTIFKKTEEEEEKEMEKEMEKHPERYKYCPDCNGIGWSDPFANCDTCKHTGYARKTYQEQVDSLPD